MRFVLWLLFCFWYASGLDTGCTQCITGFSSVSAGATSCGVCAVGFYSANGNASGVNTACIACSTGYTNANPGATSCGCQCSWKFS